MSTGGTKLRTPIRTGLGVEEQRNRDALLARRERVRLAVSAGERERRGGLADERVAGHGYWLVRGGR